MEKHITERQKVITAAAWDDKSKYNEESLSELNDLVDVAGGVVVGTATQTVRSFHPATLMGKGKLEEIRLAAETLGAELVIFDGELTGIQMREIEKVLDLPVLDRTALILDIFASRARTDVGKLQVYLAQLEYGKTHLIGKKNYSRLGGGIGTRGPGEQKLEIDRRRINDDIMRTKRKLKRAQKVRDTGRKQRERSDIPSISIVGYTNAGKSSLMNRMLRESSAQGKEVYVEDMPFASLDPDTRRITLPGGLAVCVTDTVGFISNLPTTLIESFHTTLEELKDSDLIIHMIDGSEEDEGLRYETTQKLLSDLGVRDTPIILFVNKADKMEHKKLPFLPSEHRVLYGSVREDPSIESLYAAIEEALKSKYVKVMMAFSYGEMHLVEEIKNRFPVEAFEYTHGGVELLATLPKVYLNRYEEQIRRRYV